MRKTSNADKAILSNTSRMMRQQPTIATQNMAEINALLLLAIFVHLTQKHEGAMLLKTKKNLIIRSVNANSIINIKRFPAV